MEPVILIIIACQLPVEIHANGTLESRLLLRALRCDIPCIDEDTRAVQHFQHELRRCIKLKTSLDTYVQIGQHKTRFEFPSIVYDTPAYTVLCIKREVDRHNAPLRKYAHIADADAEWVKFAGMVDLGEEGERLPDLPMPWQESYTLTSFVPPQIER